MKREFEYKGIIFYIGNYTPRRNEFERGCKYKLFYGPDHIPTDWIFGTIKEAKEFIQREWIRFAHQKGNRYGK